MRSIFISVAPPTAPVPPMSRCTSRSRTSGSSAASRSAYRSRLRIIGDLRSDVSAGFSYPSHGIVAGKAAVGDHAAGPIAQGVTIYAGFRPSLSIYHIHSPHRHDRERSGLAVTGTNQTEEARRAVDSDRRRPRERTDSHRAIRRPAAHGPRARRAHAAAADDESHPAAAPRRRPREIRAAPPAAPDRRDERRRAAADVAGSPRFRSGP